MKNLVWILAMTFGCILLIPSAESQIQAQEVPEGYQQLLPRGGIPAIDNLQELIQRNPMGGRLKTTDSTGEHKCDILTPWKTQMADSAQDDPINTRHQVPGFENHGRSRLKIEFVSGRTS